MQHKYNQIYLYVRRSEKGKNPLADTIIDNPESPEGILYSQAFEMWSTKIKRQYLEAALLCSNDYEKIAELLEIPLELVNFYSEVFFNVKDYDRLSKLDLLDKAARDKDELTLKTWALHQGLDFIAWRLGKNVSISPVDGLNELFNTCMYKSKEALFNSNSSSASIESAKWVKLSLDIARLLKLWVLDAGGAKKDLELAIKEVVPNFKSLDELLAEAEKEADEEASKEEDEE